MIGQLWRLQELLVSQEENRHACKIPFHMILSHYQITSINESHYYAEMVCSLIFYFKFYNLISFNLRIPLIFEDLGCTLQVRLDPSTIRIYFHQFIEPLICYGDNSDKVLWRNISYYIHCLSGGFRIHNFILQWKSAVAKPNI